MLNLHFDPDYYLNDEDWDDEDDEDWDEDEEGDDWEDW